MINLYSLTLGGPILFADKSPLKGICGYTTEITRTDFRFHFQNKRGEDSDYTMYYSKEIYPIPFLEEIFNLEGWKTESNLEDNYQWIHPNKDFKIFKESDNYFLDYKGSSFPFKYFHEVQTLFSLYNNSEEQLFKYGSVKVCFENFVKKIIEDPSLFPKEWLKSSND